MSRPIHGWQCDSCLKISSSISEKPWQCPVCGLEICEFCFDRFAICRKCSQNLTDQQCVEIANNAGWDFEDLSKLET